MSTMNIPGDADIRTTADVQRELLVRGMNGIRKIQWQRDANVHVAVNFAMEAGKVDTAFHPKPLQAGMDVLKTKVLGSFNASAAPVMGRTPTPEQRLEAVAAIPVAMPQQPHAKVGIKHNLPKNGL